MKYCIPIISLFVCLPICNKAYGQTKIAQVSGNNINARISNSGALFSDFANGRAAFEVPIGSNTHAFFSAALTMGGVDINGALRATSAYTVNSDYTTGPLIKGTATSSSSVEMVYDRIWQVTRNQINQHQASFSNPSYTTPTDILEWPAHGDTTAGYDFNLAPFIDVNQNGVYEPNSGDYPDVQGDFAFYFINNDDVLKTFTNTFSLGVEIHCMVYGYARNNALDEALFVDYRIINRSNLTYNNFYIGQYVDPDLGNPTDDYLEADVDRGMIFVKNGDDFDDPFQGFDGYGNNPGAAGVLVLRGPLMDDNGLDDSCLTSTNYTPNGWGFEDEDVDNELLGLTYFMPMNKTNSNNGVPSLAVHFYNYMRGIWKNGQALAFGGNGFTSTGSNCRIAYFADTDPTHYSSFGDSVANTWTEDANNLAGDRLAMLSSGSFTFSAQEEIHLTYAFIFARDTSETGVAASVDTLKDNADFIREFYFSSFGLYNCYNPVGVEERNTQKLTVFPVPTSNYVMVKDVPVSSRYRLYSLNGKLIKEGRLSGNNGKIDVSIFNNGVYLLQIQSPKGILQTKVIISK